MMVYEMISATKKRFRKFDGLKGKHIPPGEFWDIVVLTSADPLQCEAYETQINAKLDNKLLPTSAEYIVISDPPTYKIGNGGSTMVVLEALYDKYGDQFTKKKVIIIHAGGFSQRLPNASVMGKVFTAMPLNEPVYQMLEVKLASYIDFPAKIEDGGVFVCCSDTFEVYNDNDLPWIFPNTGMTGLAHPSPIEMGTTHGVYLLDATTQSHNVDSKNPLVCQCRKFMHKPTLAEMRGTNGCVIKISTENGMEETVHTDSALFISGSVCLELVAFYQENKPLTCEIDAYGDFLQSLGTESNDKYITNTVNVVSTTDSLVKVRKQVYDLLEGTPLHVVALVPAEQHHDSAFEKISSHFYHFGTTKEYLELLTEDRCLAEMLQMETLSFCAGFPHAFKPLNNPQKSVDSTTLRPAVSGLMGTTSQKGEVKTLPRVIVSVMYSGVSIGERSVLEYCKLRECVSVADNCIISNCSFKPRCRIPSNSFLHTVSVNASQLGYNFPVGYVTVAFSVHDDLKKSALKSKAQHTIKYFGMLLCDVFNDSEVAFESSPDDDVVSLWKAKLFRVHPTMEESSFAACKNLESYNLIHSGGPKCVLNDTKMSLLSMADVLKVKNVDQMLKFRQDLECDIKKTRNSQSTLPSMEGWSKSTYK